MSRGIARTSSSTRATCVETPAIALTVKWEQAAQQIDENWTLHRVGQPDVKPWDAFLVSSADLARIGMDARLVGQTVARSLRARLQPGAELVLSVDENLVDAIWTDRPALDFPPVHQHPLVFAGRAASDKLAALRGEIEKAGAAATVLANLPEIAWLLNLRGGSIPMVPVFHAYLIVTASSATLFAGVGLFDDDVRRYLEELKVELRPYGEIWAALRDLALDDKPVRRQMLRHR